MIREQTRKLKLCAKCDVPKLLEDFPKHPDTKDGRGSWCRSCHGVLTRAYYRRKKAEREARLASLPTHCGGCGCKMASDSRKHGVCGLCARKNYRKVTA